MVRAPGPDEEDSLYTVLPPPPEPVRAIFEDPSYTSLLCEGCLDRKKFSYSVGDSGELILASAFCGRCIHALSQHPSNACPRCGGGRFIDKFGAPVGKFCKNCHKIARADDCMWWRAGPPRAGATEYPRAASVSRGKARPRDACAPAAPIAPQTPEAWSPSATRASAFTAFRAHAPESAWSFAPEPETVWSSTRAYAAQLGLVRTPAPAPAPASALEPAWPSAPEPAPWSPARTRCSE
jgi:RNA polymerase subunit RPABC4/transcription elongation factor Spt4